MVSRYNYYYNIVGQVRFLPDLLEGYFKHVERIPQIYVLVDRLEQIQIADSKRYPVIITPMVFFTSNESDRQLGEQRYRSSRFRRYPGTVTFVNCPADSVQALDRATDWIAEYVSRYGREIITNFDQQRPAFQNVPFSLQNVMNGNIDRSKLQELHIYQADIICEKIDQIRVDIVHTPKVEATFKEGTIVIEKHSRRNPWISGSFYLASAVIIITLLLVASRAVSAIALPIVIVGTLLTVSIIGAYQLRQDSSLSEENFLRLIVLVFQQMPFLGRRKDNNARNN